MAAFKTIRASFMSFLARPAIDDCTGRGADSCGRSTVMRIAQKEKWGGRKIKNHKAT